MSFASLHESFSADPDSRRRLSRPCSPPPYSAHKSSAQLSLEFLLQGTNYAAGSAQARSALVPNTQARDAKPRLLLMGLRRYVPLLQTVANDPNVHWDNRSGKSSIASVVFHKMPANETLFLESTTRIQKDSIQSVPPKLSQ
ncbi:hypothetical protein N7468_007668 [Penicillium chermesinum]|uniref:GTP-binding protein n=1 Tax=Penicillium chermesinum TaxID=63820 RepID=A0A9W9TKV8_9EURO|nr:uncharacterized protein N7468_007668 [Penicillium chermesinum]KAJ5226443.1 hypothetical protein N7468_007668 [Penicillium chermesinum]